MNLEKASFQNMETITETEWLQAVAATGMVMAAMIGLAEQTTKVQVLAACRALLAIYEDACRECPPEAIEDMKREIRLADELVSRILGGGMLGGKPPSVNSAGGQS